MDRTSLGDSSLEQVTGGIGTIELIHYLKSCSIPTEIRDKLIYYLKKYGIKATEKLTESFLAVPRYKYCDDLQRFAELIKQ